MLSAGISTAVSACTERWPRKYRLPSLHLNRQITIYLLTASDHLDPSLTLWDAVQDIYTTNPTQKTCHRVCTLSRSHAAPYASPASLKYVGHEVGIDVTVGSRCETFRTGQVSSWPKILLGSTNGRTLTLFLSSKHIVTNRDKTWHFRESWCMSRDVWFFFFRKNRKTWVANNLFLLMCLPSDKVHHELQRWSLPEKKTSFTFGKSDFDVNLQTPPNRRIKEQNEKIGRTYFLWKRGLTQCHESQFYFFVINELCIR